MKNKTLFYLVFLPGLLITFCFGCKKEAAKEAPTVTLSSISNITSNSATTGGDVTSDGGAAVTTKGVCWGTNQNPTTSDSKTSNGTGTGSFTSSITGLNPGITYYLKAYAINSIGTSYSGQSTFTTVALAPALTTADVSAITTTTATSGGNVTSDGGSTVTVRGVCWATIQSPTTSNSKTTDGTGTGSFISNLTGLSSNTTYYLRAYATNGAGTNYGTEVSFKTTNPTSGTLTDVDGNIYHYVTIGTQVWMVENLKTTKYRNGESITILTSDATWSSATGGSFCYYNNDLANKDIYGVLYNWHAVSDSRNIAPAGWHIPSDAEFNTLRTYEGGEGAAGAKLKETGFTHWNSPNTGATNESGFTALPGGFRNPDGTFANIGKSTYWYTSTLGSIFGLYNTSTQMYYGFGGSVKVGGYSIRCLRD